MSTNSQQVPDLVSLNQHLHEHASGIGPVTKITRFTGGYSNLTYALETGDKAYVLRRPPQGANIKSAHDMDREFRVLSLLRPHYKKVPRPILYCGSESVIGAPFYIMEKLPGTILRAETAPALQLNAGKLRSLSTLLIDNLAVLHGIDIHATGLDQLGKPNGYMQRQVEGWTKRYYAAETDKIETLDAVARWISEHQPVEQSYTLLHNDYKYDNLLFNEELSELTGVLDWEMATVGDPLMDLGASLAYWFEAGEEDVFKHYNLSWLPGSLNRQELVARYATLSGRNVSGILFYYVFGLFKNAVIAQQIYHRWKQGHSQDARFGALLPMIKLLGNKATQALDNNTL
jgi:aminoglycoside phosphotransferase (APT) family kinase protein